jgi:hypothetical protein
MNEANNPHPDPELDGLFAIARAHRPDTSATEYAFETRLLARLCAARSTDLVWAAVSWRLVPFFAACMVALTLWQAEAVSEANEAEQIAYVENPDALDSWANLN